MRDFPAFCSGISLATALKQAPLDPLENRILLCHALKLSPITLITQSERPIHADEAQQLTALFQRRLQGEPIAYLIGVHEFYGLTLHLTPDVLIPRPETELLVELGLDRLPAQGKVLDMGTGSGAIAIAIAHSRPDATVLALDVSAAALQVAHNNAQRHLPAQHTKVDFLHSDWYAALDAQASFDLIIANPPYIAAGDIHLSQGDLRFEPLHALTDHNDGLTALRTIIAGASHHLNEKGWLLLEHGYDQAIAVRTLLAAQGLTEVQSWRDLAGIERASGGKLATTQLD